MYIFAVIQSLSHVQLFATPWTAVRQASLSLTISQSLLKLMSFPASGSFPVDQLFASGGQSIGASASATVFPMNISLEVHYSSYWNEWFSFSASSQTFGVFTVFYFSHSGMCVVILHCVVLTCSSLVGNDVEYVHVFTCHLHILLSKMSVHVFCWFPNKTVWNFLLWNFESFLYIPDTSPLLDMWFASIFSHTVVFLIVLLRVFHIVNIFNSDEIKFSNFSFCELWFCCQVEELCQTQKKVLFYTFPQSFTVTGFIFISMICFKLIFV